jgi:HEPN domain-containing protein
MINIIPNITDDQSRALNGMVAQIAKATRAEMIICYGARTSHDVVWSSFLDATDEAQSMQCDLVILTQERDKTKRDELCESAIKHNTAALKFNVLVHGVEAINDELKKGSHFFSSLIERGVVLFDSKTVSLNSPTPIAQVASEVEAYWKKRYDVASNFYRSAAHALSQGWNSQAVFLLHQAVEHACVALIKIYMGYKITTHKLSRLLSMIENFSLYSIAIFPRITQDEIRLFNVLEKAYSDSRYDDKYTVSTETANALKLEVEEVLQIAQALFIKKTVAGNTTIDKRDVSSFDSIGLDTFARVVLTQGEAEMVEVESKYGSGKCIVVKNEDKRLWVSTENLAGDKVYEATVYITYKKLSGIVLHHAESCMCKDVIEGEWLGVINNSSAPMELNIDVLVLDVTLNKHGRVILTGSADEAKIFNNRSGEISAKDLEVTNAKVVIKGSGNVSVHVEDELHAELRGSGNLILTGSPRIRTMATSGTGTLKFNNNH